MTKGLPERENLNMTVNSTAYLKSNLRKISNMNNFLTFVWKILIQLKSSYFRMRKPESNSSAMTSSFCDLEQATPYCL